MDGCKSNFHASHDSPFSDNPLSTLTAPSIVLSPPSTPLLMIFKNTHELGWGGGSNRPTKQNFTHNSSLTSQITYYGSLPSSPSPSPSPSSIPPPPQPSPLPNYAPYPLHWSGGGGGEGGCKGWGGAGMVEGNMGGKG